MCGIAGIVNFDREEPISEAYLAKMSALLDHRGPDDRGVRVERNIGLAHRRLSIIDLHNGRQPLSNEDGMVWTVFNGEIYNFCELRDELISKGHVFKTSCDTEVIVHLYEEYSDDFVSKMNGMFALALYDKANSKIILARDRLGQKPLVYYQSQKTLIFSSELNSLRQHPAVPSELDRQAIHDYLTLQYVPSPSTIFHGVNKLPPGHLLIVDIENAKSRLKKYWNIDYANKDISFEDAKERLRELLEDSVRRRMISDVPLGAFLSGGIDSTIIVKLMTKISQQPVKAFTIGFREERYDERKFANMAIADVSKSESPDIEHFQQIVNPADWESVEKLVRHYGEPYSDASMLPTYLLSEFTRQKVTVALSGDGADELFAGYYRYNVMRYAKLADFLPLSWRRGIGSTMLRMMPPMIEERTMIGNIRRLVKIFRSNPAERYLSIINRFNEELKSKLYGEAFRDFKPRGTQLIFSALISIASAPHPVEKIIETDLHSYLPGDILTKVDIASMANSLEVRSPYMDHRLAEFAASLPFSFKQNLFTRKRILREAFKDLMPAEILRRNKMGFGVPIAAWFRKKWDKPLRENLLDGEAIKNGYFQRPLLEELIKEHQQMKADHSYALWAILIFELFLKQK